MYLLCTPFSPCPLTSTRTKTFFFGTSTKLYNCSTLCLELDEVAVGHIRETFGNLILSLIESTKLKTWFKFFIFFFLFYLPFLSSIHEKANCIAILWTGSPHSLGSCLFRGLWATCLPHKGGGIPLSALPKDTTSELAGLFSTTSHKCRAPSREAIDTIF